MGSSRLEQVLAFVAVPAGGTVALAHLLNVNGTAVIPDFAAVNNGNFDVTAATTATVTVVNNGLAAANCSVRIWYEHSIERAYGDIATIQLTPAPFVIRGAGAAAALATSQVFRRTIVQPADGSDFSVTLPAAMPSDSYSVFPALSGVTSIFGIDCPDILAGDRTAAAFRVVTTAAPANGDFIDFWVVAR